MRSAAGLANSIFKSPGARSAFCGVCAHSCVPLEKPATAAFGLVLLTAAHAFGWPFAKGGSQKVVDALAIHFKSLGGKIVSDYLVTRLGDLARYKTAILDITPRQFLNIAGSGLDGSYRSALEDYRYGMGVFKMDWALKGPIPWQAAECSDAGTIHLGGRMEEIVRCESRISEGEHPAEPFVVLCQPTLFDPTRAPKGKHIAWAYCHVPNGSKVDMTSRIEAQVERFAPGFPQADTRACRPELRPVGGIQSKLRRRVISMEALSTFGRC